MMKPVNGWIMLKKRAKVEPEVGIILPDGVVDHPTESTGFDVIDVCKDSFFEVGDIVFPAYAEEARFMNGYVFCKESHILAYKEK